MFSRTDSLSRKRASTCEGTVTRSASDTITATPRPEPTASRFDDPSSTHTHSYCGVLDSTEDWEGWPHLWIRGSTSCNDPASLATLLGLFLFHFGVDSRSDLLQGFQSLLGLLTIRSIGIELGGLLIGLDSPRLHDYLELAANLLVIHRAHQRGAQQVPGLRALWIELGCFFERLDGFLHFPHVVQCNSTIAICLRGILRIKVRALFVGIHCLGNLAGAAVNAAQIVVVRRSGLQLDGLLVRANGIIGAAIGIVGIPQARPDQMEVGVFFARSTLGRLKLRDSLVRQILHLLLESVTLVRRGFGQVCLRLTCLVQKCHASLEMRFHALEFLFLFFLLLLRLCVFSALFRRYLLEVEVDLRRIGTGDAYLYLIRLVGRRQLHC